MMTWLRRMVYRLGIRPKPGSIFFSPSMNLHLVVWDGLQNVTYPNDLPQSEQWKEYFDSLPEVKGRIQGEWVDE